LAFAAGVLQHRSLMPWIRRRNRSYYYRSIRNGRAILQYVGRGPVAELVAAHDELRRTERQAEREAVDSVRRDLAPLEAVMDELGRGCDEHIEASLRSVGYYHRHGHWRGRLRVRAIARASKPAG
jgi:hypothetical protein